VRRRESDPTGGTYSSERNSGTTAKPASVQLTPLRAAGVVAALALAVACAIVLDPVSAAVVGALGCALLVAVSVVDLEALRVPNRIVLPGLAAALVARTALDPSPRWLVGAVLAGGTLLALALIHPAGLGMGDVKLAAFLGAWLAWNGVLALLLASFAAFLPAVGIIIARGRAARKVALPFAPFLALGGVVALFAGHDIVDWYRSLGS
jgi:leader peptidase (prepilin peptidase)/N-methyltransferase